MQSILEEISKLRDGAPIIIDYHNSNRYRLVVKENDGYKTAYYFSTPIYNKKSRKMIDIKFKSDGNTIFLTGSNSNITISNNVLMKNEDGFCSIELPKKYMFVSQQEVHCGNIVLSPTTNGVALKCSINPNEKIDLIVDVEHPFLNVRANDRCLALMKENFTPFVVFSCVGSVDVTGNVIAAAKIEYKKLTDKRYKIVLSSMSAMAQYVLLEANLYDNKLFQDTTVESKSSSINNAFGDIGFIGNSQTYGEQWLYSRIDYSKISEIMDKRIHRVVLHIPKFNKNNVQLSVYKVAARFCSFGSNWNNKIAADILISHSYYNDDYLSLDLTSLFVNQQTKSITKSEGFILKPKIKGQGFSVVSSGDSYLAPQIMEIKFR